MVDKIERKLTQEEINAVVKKLRDALHNKQISKTQHAIELNALSKKINASKKVNVRKRL